MSITSVHSLTYSNVEAVVRSVSTVTGVSGLLGPTDIVGKQIMTEDDLKETVQDCNLNFLLGSGLSCPFLTTLGNLESLLTQVEESTAEARQKAIVKASLYHHYFNSVISKNIQIQESEYSC